MQKVFIISYFFEPCKFVGSERVEYWAKNLHIYGFFPIILTRQWNQGQIDLTGKVINNKYEHIVYDNYEVYKLPYKRTLRDKLAKHKNLSFFRKILTFIESIFSNFFLKALPFSNFYQQADYILKNNPKIKFIINSLSPHHALFISYKLKKKYPEKIFIADYRDEWTTRKTNFPNNFLEKIIFKLNKISEKRWASNTDFFITVSEKWKHSLSIHLNKKGYVVKNGHNIDKNSYQKKTATGKKLKIIYVGTLYSYQKIEIFINAAKRLSIKYPKSIKVDFYGLEIRPDQKTRLQELTKGFENLFFIHTRINKKELSEKLKNSDIGLLTSYENLDGCLPVKIFDYYSHGLNILMCPSDLHEMESFILKTNSGVVVNTEEECYNELLKFVTNKQTNKMTYPKKNNYFSEYSRENQTSILSKILLKY